MLRQVLRAFGESDEPGPPDLPAANELAQHAREFAQLDVGDVMTPRADIQAIEIDTPFEDVVARFLETEHSRLPVFRETLDDPVGVIHIKDIFRLMADGRKAKTGALLRKLKREVLYVPEAMPATALLEKMQANRVHLALVIDEHGGVSGLATLEDLLEAVVGEIDDGPPRSWKKISTPSPAWSPPWPAGCRKPARRSTIRTVGVSRSSTPISAG
jgi:CBS domain containing-hemolysin-like protein